MRPTPTFLAGLALLATGSLKIWFHLNTKTTMSIPGCLGTDFTIELSSASSGLMHCWGCYVAAFGFSILATSVISGLSAPRARTPNVKKVAT